ncbi:alpha-amylase family glycosyl hydrolase [Spirosoma pollinicola]|uniref:Uncharacterized protein n=1 Tax=Spirosoma pollinicola TaxID=2057025 RepID=A0A2K8Z185_9BACT|nr:alpha-amylase family glycosyl hydrolase [Spirosoma pollinicola]AUD03660.1 hypothetical protein CWM47_18610 [Spirosoma pollinicola]
MNVVKNQFDITRRTLGVTFSADQKAHVTIWAPQTKHVALAINDESVYLPLTADNSGYWHLDTDQLKPGDTYAFILDDDKKYADPASLTQPQGVNGSSQAVDTSKFYWEDSCWVNPPLDEYTLFELNIQTFSLEGTVDAVIKKLGKLKKLGINALLIKQISSSPESTSDFFPYALQAGFGGPYQLHHLINICHFDGIAVVLDVNYTEMGKQNDYATCRHADDREADRDESNFAHDAHREAKRRHIIDNALMWFRDFHVDVLRLNAVHTLPDSDQILNDIRTYTNQLTAVTGIHHCLLVDDERANKSLTGETAIEQERKIDPNSITDQYNGYCSDYQASKLPIKTYREDYLYDEHFSSTLRELVGR